jgi:CDP-paratose synthetase
MKILLTGATGFIGKHLLRALQRDGHELGVIVRPQSNMTSMDLTGIKQIVDDGSTQSLIAEMKAMRADGILHLASCFLSQHGPEDISELIDSNLSFGCRVLEAAVAAQVSWFLNTGTFWQHYNNASYSPVNLYAATKEAFESLAQFYIESTDITFVTLKLSDTFGPGDTRKKLFQLLMDALSEEQHLDMSAGEQLIDISYIDNVIEAYTQLIALLSLTEGRPKSSSSYAVMAEKRLSLRELVALFEELAGAKLDITFGPRPYRPREVMIPWENGVPVPGWRPRISIEEGIKRLMGLKPA